MKNKDIIRILSEDIDLRTEVLRGLNRKGVDLFEGLGNLELSDFLLRVLNERELYINFLEYRLLVKRKADYIIRGVSSLDVMMFNRLELELATYYSGKDNPDKFSGREILIRDIKEELERIGYE